MKVLELFSGTHSIGKACKELGNYEITSVDRDLGASHDNYTTRTSAPNSILTWDYKQYPRKHFDIITASPVCLWWSQLRGSWINRKCKSIHPTDVITKEHIDNDIERYGKPMVDKVFEIIEYFKPKYWWVENPKTGKMKHYIAEKYPQYNTYYDVDYCKYCDWGYKKSTRFWTNITDFVPLTCKNDCENIVGTKHVENLGSNNYIVKDQDKYVRVNTKAKREKYKDFERLSSVKHKNLITDVGGGTNRLQRYRIPPKLVIDLLKACS